MHGFFRTTKDRWNVNKLVFTYSLLANLLTLSFTSLGSLPWCLGQTEGLKVLKVLPSENAKRVQILKHTKYVLKTNMAKSRETIQLQRASAKFEYEYYGVRDLLASLSRRGLGTRIEQGLARRRLREARRSNVYHLWWVKLWHGTLVKGLFKFGEKRSIACFCTHEQKMKCEGFTWNGCYDD